PEGMIWDNSDWSCAYDSLLTVLYNVWRENPNHWSGKISIFSDYCALFVKGIDSVRSGYATLERARNVVRDKLREDFPALFPVGSNLTSIGELAYRLFGTD
ncbi:hypothetical protein CPC08DRAFT_600527, partial [Agrocybe pediades]